MNRINFGLSLIFLAGIGAVLFFWMAGPSAVGTAPPSEITFEDIDGEDDEKDLDPLEGYEPAEGLIDNAELTTNAAGIQIIKDYEGLELESYETAGTYHIGYGHGADVEAGQTISKEEAEEFLLEDLTVTESAVRAAVELPLNENEFSALVSFTYNIGISAFWSSTVLTELNAGNRQAAADGFLLWNKMSQDGQLVQSMSLTDRREAERALFLKPVEENGEEDTSSDEG